MYRGLAMGIGPIGVFLFKGRYPLLSLFLVLTLCWVCAYAEEDFSCHRNTGFRFLGEKTEKGVIIPRGDIIVEVGTQKKEVLCRFNSSLLDAKDVYFTTREKVLPYEVVNSSTIRTVISHSQPEKYVLYCKLKRKKRGDKSLCSQMVSAGYLPKDIENLSCVSRNNEMVNCSWDRPDNPILTTYRNATFSVPKYIKISPCPESSPNSFGWCHWNKSIRFKLRDEFDLHITGSNKLGTKTYVHRIRIPEIVIPNKVESAVTSAGPVRAKVTWNLTYPMDVFHSGLWHCVEKRLQKDGEKWQNETFFFHKVDIKELTPKRMFSVEVDLPYGVVTYEFRVRIHTGVGDIREEMWSDFDVLEFTAGPIPPLAAPLTSGSSFEVVEGLEMRDIYVNFGDVDNILKGGKDFHYNMLVYPSSEDSPLDVEPAEMTKAYFKYKAMNFTGYKFKITPVNEMGPSPRYSEVVVPNSDCMPKKTEMFTVISSSNETARTFSLYWVPSQTPSQECREKHSAIDSYTIYWCRKTLGYRCKEKLTWKDIPLDGLVTKDLSTVTPSDIVMYEYNITDLTDDALYTFGVASNAGTFSSGIRWSSCIVDESEPPLPPVTEVEAPTNDSRSVLVRWSLKCMSISAVPVGFNVSYCKSTVQDFGHCNSEVEHVKINSPSSNQILISGLDAAISYIFSVSVLSIIGEGRQSYPKIMKLREGVPNGPPLDFSALSVSNTSVNLSWSPPSKWERGGVITEYKISAVPLLPRDRRDVYVTAPEDSEESVQYNLGGLHPFTSYEMRISACTDVGCGFNENRAKTNFKTTAGVPDSVEDFTLDVSNWRLVWDLKHCNSRNCSFEVMIPDNETEFRTVTVHDKETLSLREEGIPCNETEMTFQIRAKGQDDAGAALFSRWIVVTKEPSDCPPEYLEWWAICIIVVGCMLLTVCILFIVKYGGRTIKETIQVIRARPAVPDGIDRAELTCGPRKNFSAIPSKGSYSSVENLDPPLLFESNSPQSDTPGRAVGKIRAESVSSEEVNLIPASDLEQRHGRNLSGNSSDNSSGKDSAMMSGGSSINQIEPADRMLSEETSLRQRNLVPPYVQPGIIHEKLPDGYVTARSVPSLPHLYKDGALGNQQSTPDLKAGVLIMNWQNARRASTGYISMPDSDASKESPHRAPENTLVPVLNMNAPRVGGYTGLPPYSRHSFSPEVKFEGAKGGYVTLADGHSPTHPMTDKNVGYVSAGDPLGSSLKRPPSLPQIPKSFSVEGELPLSAYCRVGSRGNSANQGYVSASRIGSMVPPPDIPHGAKNSHYVSCGVPTPGASPQSMAFSPCNGLKDPTGRWALPSMQPRSPIVSSAPAESERTATCGRVGPLPRPNTTEAVIGRKYDNPSLSKQSSGYVSQETIAPCEPVVISPKRLLTQTAAPHSIVMSPSHQASMV